LNRVTEQITGLMKIPATLSRIIPGDFTVTPPVIALLCANSITFVLAVAGNWDAATVLFIYWAQKCHHRDIHGHLAYQGRYRGNFF
jgi:hypothetical protein